MPLNGSDVGRRVVVRHRIGERDGRPQYTDVLGELLRFDDRVVVRTADGVAVDIAPVDVVAGKPVPPRPTRRTTELELERIEDLELERIAALGWPGLRVEYLGGWMLRAGGGWTGRANSALPLGEPGRDLDAAVDHVVRWYAGQGLPPTFQLPLPSREELRVDLAGRGWTDRWGAVVMTARIADVLARVPARTGLPLVRFSDTPEPAWLAAYHYRGGPLPPVAADVLRAGTGLSFASVVEDGVAVAICRTAESDGWLGITAVEVDPAHRRRGLASHLLVGVLRHTRTARWSYLQVEGANVAARTLYGRAGYTDHHRYRYYRPAAGR